MLIELVGGPLDGQLKNFDVGWGNVLAEGCRITFPVALYEGSPTRDEVYVFETLPDRRKIARYEGGS
jgi:hypothetical protein